MRLLQASAETTWADVGLAVVKFAREDIWGFVWASLFVAVVMCAMAFLVWMMIPRAVRFMEARYSAERDKKKAKELFDD